MSPGRGSRLSHRVTIHGVGSEPGIPFGDYTLLKRIARGGMAEVFLARQQGLVGFDRTVAIKRILPHLLDDISFVRMFQQEARLAARLSHPNIVHIYDFGKVEEHFFIAMEFMRGVHAGDLIRFAESTPLPPALVARIGAEACAGLNYAHNRRDEKGKPLRIVHRDMSPPNLLVSFDGAVKIVDFGIAKAVSTIEQTRPGVVKGKYAYMSPEQTMGLALDDRSDVFSLALVLWELLAGQSAVSRNDQLQAMRTIRDGKVPAIESVVKDIAPELAQGLANALHRDANRRSSAREFGDQLEVYLKSTTATSSKMALGSWLTDNLSVPLPCSDDGKSTRPATALSADILEPRPVSKTDRGSVVARLSENTPVARQASAAAGDMHIDSNEQPHLSDESNSVVIESDLIEGAETCTAADTQEQLSHESLTTANGPVTEITEVADSPFTEVRKRSPIHEELSRVPSKRSPLRLVLVGLALLSIVAVVFIPTRHRAANHGEDVDIKPAVRAIPQIVVTPLPSNEAVLEIITRPPGAEISIGGQLRGTSPATFPDLPPGELTIRIDLVDHLSQERSVTLKANEYRSLEMSLDKKPIKNRRNRQAQRDAIKSQYGKLAVRTKPYSVVYHKGKKLGVTPLINVQLKAGRYVLTLKNPEYPPIVRTAVIRAGETTKLDVTLTEM